MYHPLNKLMKAASIIVLPLLLLALAYVAYQNVHSLSAPQLDLVKLAPYPVFLIGGGLAWKFNRSREFFLILLFTLAAVSLQYLPKLPGTGASIALPDLYLILGIVLPLNILLFSFLKERGIFSLWGFIRIGLIAAQAAAAVWLLMPEQNGLLEQLNKELLPVNLPGELLVSQLSLLVFVIAWISLLVKQIPRRTSQDISCMAVLLGMFYVLNMDYEPIAYALMWVVSSIILLASIIQDSYAMAFTDELTGLPSRRALKQDMMKLGMNYAIAMLDIDHFKKFNDTYGHDTGDEVLKLVASTVREVTGGGKAFRYGGEEFSILFPGKSIQDTLPHLEELRERVAKRGFTLRGNGRGKSKSKQRAKARNAKTAKQIYITVSIGISQKNEKNKTPDTVMKAADTALYRAKKKGRNCVSK
jgi:diguanylate cyclase (GGDEF)-like protein